jgi:hypothetical protein
MDFVGDRGSFASATFYEPQTKVMSSAKKACRTLFSAGKPIRKSP